MKNKQEGYEKRRINKVLGDFVYTESQAYKYLTSRFGPICGTLIPSLANLVEEKTGIQFNRSAKRNKKVFFRILQDNYELLSRYLFPFIEIVYKNAEQRS